MAPSAAVTTHIPCGCKVTWQCGSAAQRFIAGAPSPAPFCAHIMSAHAELPKATAADWQRRFNVPLVRSAAEGMRLTLDDQRKWRLVLAAALLVAWLALRGDTSPAVRDGLRELLVQRGACLRGRGDTSWGGIWAVLCAAHEHAAMAAALLGPELWPTGASPATAAAALAAQLEGADRGASARTALLERWLAAGCTSVHVLQEQLALLKADLYVRGAFGGTTPRYFRDTGVQVRAARAALTEHSSASRLYVGCPGVAGPEAAGAPGEALHDHEPHTSGGGGDRWAGGGSADDDNDAPAQPRPSSSEPSAGSDSDAHEREDERCVGRRGRAVRRRHKARARPAVAKPCQRCANSLEAYARGS